MIIRRQFEQVISKLEILEEIKADLLHRLQQLKSRQDPGLTFDVKSKRRFRTIEELWDLEEKYPCVVGASLASMGAAVDANSKLQTPAVRNGKLEVWRFPQGYWPMRRGMPPCSFPFSSG